MIDKNKIVNDKVQEKCPGRKMKLWEHGVWTNDIKCIFTDVWKSYLANFHSSQLEIDIISWD